MDPRARSAAAAAAESTSGGAWERRGRSSMTLRQMDEHVERCWRYCQEKQETDPSWCRNLPLLGEFKPYSETVADLERLRQVNARIRGELEAEAAAGGDGADRPLACLQRSS